MKSRVKRRDKCVRYWNDEFSMIPVTFAQFVRLNSGMSESLLRRYHLEAIPVKWIAGNTEFRITNYWIIKINLMYVCLT